MMCSKPCLCLLATSSVLGTLNDGAGKIESKTENELSYRMVVYNGAIKMWPFLQYFVRLCAKMYWFIGLTPILH